MSKVTPTRDIKIAHIPFEYGKLDINHIIVINVNMQSTLIVDQFRFLVNTSLAVGMSLQYMENKIEKLNTKIQQIKGDCSQKDKMVARLHNQNKELIEKLARKNVEHDKILQESKADLETLKK